jgi:hypothetical protein
MMSELIMTKPQQVRKPRKGDCGTCHWFERAPQEPKAGVPWSGICLYNPPLINQTAIPNVLSGQMQAMMQGIHPPVSEIARCHHWTSLRQYYDGEEGKEQLP